ncbi:MAG: polyphosphate kinase 2 family protein [Thermoplasmata archaeon]
MVKKYVVRPGQRVRLVDWPTDDTSFARGPKDEGHKELDRLKDRLEGLQELLYADRSHAVLIVLQGMDAAGKDGTIRRVFDGVNPQGVRVASFKKPTEVERSHDFLWRIHEPTPAKGEIVIFNRSQYEDVLVPRVHDRIPKKVWERRYAAIKEFERTLTEEGTTVLKFFLHVSRAEQKRRLKERLDDPTKHWKFREGDLQERKLWKEYMEAYEELLTKTSTSWAPWHIVPADRKWYRDLVVCQHIVATLASLRMRYPPLLSELRGTKIS